MNNLINSVIKFISPPIKSKSNNPAIFDTHDDEMISNKTHDDETETFNDNRSINVEELIVDTSQTKADSQPISDLTQDTVAQNTHQSTEVNVDIEAIEKLKVVELRKKLSDLNVHCKSTVKKAGLIKLYVSHLKGVSNSMNSEAANAESYMEVDNDFSVGNGNTVEGYESEMNNSLTRSVKSTRSRSSHNKIKLYELRSKERVTRSQQKRSPDYKPYFGPPLKRHNRHSSPLPVSPQPKNVPSNETPVTDKTMKSSKSNKKNKNILITGSRSSSRLNKETVALSPIEIKKIKSNRKVKIALTEDQHESIVDDSSLHNEEHVDKSVVDDSSFHNEEHVDNHIESLEIKVAEQVQHSTYVNVKEGNIEEYNSDNEENYHDVEEFSVANSDNSQGDNMAMDVDGASHTGGDSEAYEVDYKSENNLKSLVSYHSGNDDDNSSQPSDDQTEEDADEDEWDGHEIDSQVNHSFDSNAAQYFNYQHSMDFEEEYDMEDNESAPLKPAIPYVRGEVIELLDDDDDEIVEDTNKIATVAIDSVPTIPKNVEPKTTGFVPTIPKSVEPSISISSTQENNIVASAQEPSISNSAKQALDVFNRLSSNLIVAAAATDGNGIHPGASGQSLSTSDYELLRSFLDKIKPSEASSGNEIAKQYEEKKSFELKNNQEIINTHNNSGPESVNKPDELPNVAISSSVNKTRISFGGSWNSRESFLPSPYAPSPSVASFMPTQKLFPETNIYKKPNGSLLSIPTTVNGPYEVSTDETSLSLTKTDPRKRSSMDAGFTYDSSVNSVNNDEFEFSNSTKRMSIEGKPYQATRRDYEMKSYTHGIAHSSPLADLRHSTEQSSQQTSRSSYVPTFRGNSATFGSIPQNNVTISNALAVTGNFSMGKSTTSTASSSLSYLQRRRIQQRQSVATNNDLISTASTSSTVPSTGIVAKRILETLGDLVTPMEDMRRKPKVVTWKDFELDIVNNNNNSSKTLVSNNDLNSKPLMSKEPQVNLTSNSIPNNYNNSNNNIYSNNSNSNDEKVSSTFQNIIQPAKQNTNNNNNSSSNNQLTSLNQHKTVSFATSVKPAQVPAPNNLLFDSVKSNNQSLKSTPFPSNAFDKTINTQNQFKSSSSKGEEEDEFTFEAPLAVTGIDDDHIVDSFESAVKQYPSKETQSIKYTFTPPSKHRKQSTAGNTPFAKKSNSSIIPDSETKPKETKDQSMKNTANDSIWKKAADTSNEIKCSFCLVKNKAGAEKCASCENPLGNNDSKKSSNSDSSSNSNSSNSNSIWSTASLNKGIKCQSCMVMNKDDAVKCVACETSLNPGVTSKINLNNIANNSSSFNSNSNNSISNSNASITNKGFVFAPAQSTSSTSSISTFPAFLSTSTTGANGSIGSTGFVLTSANWPASSTSTATADAASSSFINNSNTKAQFGNFPNETANDKKAAVPMFPTSSSLTNSTGFSFTSNATDNEKSSSKRPADNNQPAAASSSFKIPDTKEEDSSEQPNKKRSSTISFGDSSKTNQTSFLSNSNVPNGNSSTSFSLPNSTFNYLNDKSSIKPLEPFVLQSELKTATNEPANMSATPFGFGSNSITSTSSNNNNNKINNNILQTTSFPNAFANNFVANKMKTNTSFMENTSTTAPIDFKFSSNNSTTSLPGLEPSSSVGTILPSSSNNNNNISHSFSADASGTNNNINNNNITNSNNAFGNNSNNNSDSAPNIGIGSTFMNNVDNKSTSSSINPTTFTLGAKRTSDLNDNNNNNNNNKINTFPFSTNTVLGNTVGVFQFGTNSTNAPAALPNSQSSSLPLNTNSFSNSSSQSLPFSATNNSSNISSTFIFGHNTTSTIATKPPLSNSLPMPFMFGSSDNNNNNNLNASVIDQTGTSTPLKAFNTATSSFATDSPNSSMDVGGYVSNDSSTMVNISMPPVNQNISSMGTMGTMGVPFGTSNIGLNNNSINGGIGGFGMFNSSSTGNNMQVFGSSNATPAFGQPATLANGSSNVALFGANTNNNNNSNSIGIGANAAFTIGTTVNTKNNTRKKTSFQYSCFNVLNRISRHSVEYMNFKRYLYLSSTDKDGVLEITDINIGENDVVTKVNTSGGIGFKRIDENTCKQYDLKLLKQEISRQYLRSIKKTSKALEKKPFNPNEIIDGSFVDDTDTLELKTLQHRTKLLKELEEMMLGIKSVNDKRFQDEILPVIEELDISDKPPPKPERGPKKTKSPPTGPRKPYFIYTSLDGIEIRVGRGASDNDQLSCNPEHRHPDNWWMHAAGSAGSHVVIRCEEDDILTKYRQTVIDAALLAAVNSKSNQSGKVSVSLTRCRYVTKPNGAKDGLVRLNGEITTINIDIKLESVRFEKHLQKKS
eukprot:gene7560-10301_t